MATSSGYRNLRLKPNYFDLSKWIGKEAQLKVIDESSESWGRILVDHFVLSDTKPESTNWNHHTRSFTVSKDQLVLPIRDLTREERDQFAKAKDWLEIKGSIVQLRVEGKVVREYSVLLADSAEDADWFASLNIEEFEGKQASKQAFTAGVLQVLALRLCVNPTPSQAKKTSTKRPTAHNFTSPRRPVSAMTPMAWSTMKDSGTTSGNTIR